MSKKSSAGSGDTAVAKPVRKKRGKLALLVFFVSSALLIFLLKQAYIFLLIAALPSIVAYVTDASRNRTSFYVVLSCNLAGILPYLATLVHQQNATQAVQAVLSQPLVWLVVYSAAGLGWLLNWTMPYVAQFGLELLNSNEVNACRQAQKRLVDDWGDGIRGTE